jgi:hypothetical protein
VQSADKKSFEVFSVASTISNPSHSLPIRKERINPQMTQMNADEKPKENNLRKSVQSADKKSFEVFFVGPTPSGRLPRCQRGIIYGSG